MQSIKHNWADIDFSQSAQARKGPCPPLQKPYDSKKELIALPGIKEIAKPKTLAIDAILNRKSRRKFNDKALSLEELALLLFCTQGVKWHNDKYGLRAVPSAGARHAFETYLYCSRVEGLAKGLYRYLALEHSLILEGEIDENREDELDEALNGQLYEAAVYFIWTAVPYRMEWRYPVITPKLLALDAGHVCQNLYLACETIGCGTCAIGAYDQSKMDSFLKIDGENEFAIYMAPVGKVEG